MSTELADLAGIVPPVATPLTQDAEVDAAALRKLLGFVLDAGVSGVFVLGSSGEAPYLTDAQRASVISTTTDLVAGQVPVLAGVLDTTAQRVLDQESIARRARADCIVATAPYYARASEAELLGHFRHISRRVEVPVIAYDIPSRAGTKLPTAVLKELAEDRTIIGVKDSSGDLQSLCNLVDSLREIPRFSVLTGQEALADMALFGGADGIVPGLANVDPHGYVRLYNAAVGGDWVTVRSEQTRLRKLLSIIDVGRQFGLGTDASAYGGFKTALKLRAVIGNDRTAPPQLPLPDQAKAAIRSSLIDAGLL